MKTKTCCFIGHREINETETLRGSLRATIENLITEENVDTFLFGSKSRFDSLCLELVTEARKKYMHIKRVWVRADYPEIDDSYREYLLELYDDTYFPEKLIGAGKAAYVKRNYEMIKNSDICVVYYDESALPAGRRSGAGIALAYAEKHNKRILRMG